MQSPFPSHPPQLADFSNTIWRKSSHSQGTGGECVELASVTGAVGVRDSKNPLGPKLVFSQTEFAAFSEAVRQGTYDL